MYGGFPSAPPPSQHNFFKVDPVYCGNIGHASHFLKMMLGPSDPLVWVRDRVRVNPIPMDYKIILLALFITRGRK